MTVIRSIISVAVCFLFFYASSSIAFAQDFEFKVKATHGAVYVNGIRLIDGSTQIPSGARVEWSAECDGGYGDLYDGHYFRLNIETIPSMSIFQGTNIMDMNNDVSVTVACAENPPASYNVTVESSPHGTVRGRGFSKAMLCGEGNDDCSIDIPIRKGFYVEAIPAKGYKAVGFYNPDTQHLFEGHYYCSEELSKCWYSYEFDDYASTGPVEGMRLKPIYELELPLSMWMTVIIGAGENSRD